MKKFDKILADHDDVLTHGIILYSKADDPDHVYADKACTIPVEGDELKDIYLKGCVVATVSDGVETGSYSKPASLEVTPEGTSSLVGGGSSNGGSGGVNVMTIVLTPDNFESSSTNGNVYLDNYDPIYECLTAGGFVRFSYDGGEVQTLDSVLGYYLSADHGLVLIMAEKSSYYDGIKCSNGSYHTALSNAE